MEIKDDKVWGIKEIDETGTEVIVEVKSKIKKPKTKKVKEVITLPISDWADEEVLTNRIKVKYGAVKIGASNKGITFEGENHIVELKKI